MPSACADKITAAWQHLGAKVNDLKGCVDIEIGMRKATIRAKLDDRMPGNCVQPALDATILRCTSLLLGFK